MSKFPDDEKTPISTFNLPEETDIKTPELTCAETIAMFFNNIDTNRTANQRTIDTANFVLGCSDPPRTKSGKKKHLPGSAGR